MKQPQECADREYWDKRFNFAAWLFLILSLCFIIFTDNLNSALIAAIVSFGYRIVNTVQQIRHLRRHITGEIDRHEN